jgi:hypothetical protein
MITFRAAMRTGRPGTFRQDRSGGVRIGRWLSALVLLAGCARLFPETSPPTGAPPDVKRVSFVLVARNYRCQPDVMAVDREGRSALVKVIVRSEGTRHVFSIPDLGVRRYVDPGQEATIEFLAERSGIFAFGCTRFPLITPLDHKGKLAIK